MVLLKDGARAEVVEHYSQRKIRIRVSGPRKKEMLSIVNHEFEKIHRTYERLKYQTQVPCNCSLCQISEEPHFFALDQLHRALGIPRGEIQCVQSFEMVEARSLINEVMGTSNTQQVTRLQSDLDHQKAKSLQVSPPEVKPTRDQVFISYSHQDADWLQKLQTFLKPMIRNRAISTWDDTQIEPGKEWRKEIEAALAAAKVAVLLVSQDFFNSNFIAENELPPLLNAAEHDGLTILWIPLRYSTYEDSPIAIYQAAHPPGQPLSSLPLHEQEAALVKIAQCIKDAANKVSQP